MKITKSQLKQIIKEELGAAMGKQIKPEKSTDEQIAEKATQIDSITKTSRDLDAISALAMEIVALTEPSWPETPPWTMER
jgi:hypothetical protein